MIAHQAAWWDAIIPEYRARLDRADENMIRRHRTSRQRAILDPRYAFKPGDLVLLNYRRPGKLATKSSGPHEFIAYKGAARFVAQLKQRYTGRQIEVSVANLLPIRGDLSSPFRHHAGLGPFRARMEAAAPSRPSSPFASSMSSVHSSDLSD